MVLIKVKFVEEEAVSWWKICNQHPLIKGRLEWIVDQEGSMFIFADKVGGIVQA